MDTRTLALPQRLADALNPMMLRILRTDVARLRSDVTFGDLAQIDEDFIDRLVKGSYNVFDARSLITCLKRIDPYTPVCSSCGDIPLDVIGGQVIDAPPVGAVCPMCKVSILELVPMVLRKVHWVTGQLIDPGLHEDYRSRPGVRIPLSDMAIYNWMGLRQYTAFLVRPPIGDIPLYGVLAYAFLHERLFTQAEDAFRFLTHPEEFGLDPDALNAFVLKAGHFLDEREIRNTPRVYLSDGRRRDEFTSVTIGAREYLVEGLVGHGDKCDVYRGRWDREPTQLVIIKVLRNDDDAELLAQEVRNVQILMRSNEPASEYMKLSVPVLLDHGLMTLPDGSTHQAVVYRYQHGFDWTLSDCLAAYPAGIDVKTMVWMMNRLLLQMSWWHDTGLVHCAPLPQHLLVHPRDHALSVIDWSMARKRGSRLDIGVKDQEAFYPPEVFAGEPVTELTDIAMACRTMIFMVGGNPATGELPAHVPSVIADMLRANARYQGIADRVSLFTKAAAFFKAFGNAAESVYGPKSYHPFHMPPAVAQADAARS